jgi:hypothetical protein
MKVPEDGIGQWQMSSCSPWRSPTSSILAAFEISKKISKSVAIPM